MPHLAESGSMSRPYALRILSARGWTWIGAIALSWTVWTAIFLLTRSH